MNKQIFLIFAIVFFLSFVSSTLFDDGTIVSYYKLDNSTGVVYDMIRSNDGTNSGALRGIPGKINNSFYFNGSNQMVNVTDDNTLDMNDEISIQAWVNTSSLAGGYIVAKGATGDYQYGLRYANGNVTMTLWTAVGGNHLNILSNTTINDGNWHHIVGVGKNNSYVKIYIDGVLKGESTVTAGLWNINGAEDLHIGGVNSFTGEVDEVGIWNKSLSASEVIDLYNSGDGLPFGGADLITLLSPIDGTTISDIGDNFTVEGSNLSDLSGTWNNLTYNIWQNGTLINSTTVLLTGVTFNKTQFIDNFTFADYEWNAEACYTNVTGSYCISKETNNTFSVSLFTLIEENYVNETVSGTLENFSISVDILEGYSLENVEFMYNGTSNSPSIIAEGDNRFLLVTDFQIPVLVADENATFYWELSFAGGYVLNSTTRTQLIRAVLLDNCSAFTYKLLNISLFDEKTKNSLSGSIEISYSLLNKPAYQEVNTYSFSVSGVSNVNVCSGINLSAENLAYSAEIRYGAPDHVSELYNIQRGDLGETFSILNLFSLNESQSTEFLVKYQDNSLTTVEGAVINLLRKYIGEDLYESVEAPTTSNIGTAKVHVDLDANSYKAIVTKNGVVLDIFDNLVFDCESELTGQCTQNLFGEINPQNSVPVYILDDFSYSIIGVDNLITTTFVIPSGVPARINIILAQRDMFGNSFLCNETIVSSSGSLGCSYNDSMGDSVIELYILKNGDLMVQQSYLIKEAGTLDWLGNNFFIVLVLFLSLVGMGMSTPEWIIINGVITMVLCGGIWLLNGLNFVIGLGTLMWLIISAMILIMKISNQEDR